VGADVDVTKEHGLFFRAVIERMDLAVCVLGSLIGEPIGEER
jgi:hypothetical protein